MPNADYYFENVGDRFLNKSQEKGLDDRGISRGSVTFDYDNDGDQDLLVVNQIPVSDGLKDASPTLLFRNDSTRGNWIKIELAGKESDRNGIGSRIEVVAGNIRMIREVDGGSSHLSQNSAVVHFGLATVMKVDSINVTWVGGKKQSLLNQACNQKITIHEIECPPRYKKATAFSLIGAACVILGIVVFALKFLSLPNFTAQKKSV
jgi:hypothetical protein